MGCSEVVDVDHVDGVPKFGGSLREPLDPVGMPRRVGFPGDEHDPVSGAVLFPPGVLGDVVVPLSQPERLQAEHGDGAAAERTQGAARRMITAGNETHVGKLRNGRVRGQCRIGREWGVQAGWAVDADGLGGESEAA